MKFKTLLLSFCWLLAGCLRQGQHQVEQLERVHGMPMSELMASWRALQALEAKVGFSFPGNSVMVNSTVDTWTLFSPGEVMIPLVPAAGVKTSVNLPLADAVELVNGKMQTRQVTQPQFAFRSEWQTNGYEFRGTIVRSVQGDYSVIEQLRRN